MCKYQYWKPPNKKTEQEFEEWWLSIKRTKNIMCKICKQEKLIDRGDVCYDCNRGDI